MKDKKVKDKKAKNRKAPKNKYWEKFASASIGRKLLTVIGCLFVLGVVTVLMTVIITSVKV